MDTQLEGNELAVYNLINRKDDNYINNAFSAIKDFVYDLQAYYEKSGTDPLYLYYRLILKIGDNVDLKRKAVEPFILFIKDNSISSTNINFVGDGIVPYGESKKIYIDVKYHYELADKEAKTMILEHLIALSILIDDSVDLKLSKEVSDEEPKTAFDDLMDNIINICKTQNKENTSETSDETSPENPVQVAMNFLQREDTVNLMNKIAEEFNDENFNMASMFMLGTKMMKRMELNN